MQEDTGVVAAQEPLERLCEVDDCARPHLARGMCGKHYQRWRKFNDPRFVKPNLGNRKPRPIPARRTCRTCGLEGDASLFKPKANICKRCARQYTTEWARSNPEKVRASLERHAEANRRRELRRRATRNGQDPDLVEAYYEAHNGRCEICGGLPGQRDLSIDHDHVTGKFRGLLCGSCNNGLGRFKDDIGNLEAAISYLRRAGTDPRALFAA